MVKAAKKAPAKPGRSKVVVAKSKPATARTRKLTKKQAKAKAKREAGKRLPIIGSFKLTGVTTRTVLDFWRPLGGIVLVYLILNLIFVNGIGALISETSSLRNSGSKFTDALSSFGSLVGSSSTSNASTNSVLQSVLFVITSLTIIWALRQLLAGKAVRVKWAYYHGMSPAVPFVLLIFLIIIQLLPASIGALVLGAVVASYIGGFANLLFGIVFAGLLLWSLYMLTASVLALYIVTLPDMEPLTALRSARNLVRFRRWTVMRRMLFLPLLLLVAFAVVLVPIIFLVPVLAPVVFYLLLMVAMAFGHTYYYSLYRSLLT